MTEAEFVQHYEDHARWLVSYMRRRFGASDAEDFAAHAWLNAWNNRAAFNRESSFKSWLTRIAINHAISVRTRGKLGRSRICETPITINLARTVATNTENTERSLLMKERVDAALDRAGMRDAQIMKMHFVYGFSVEELAGVNRLNVNTIKVRLTRACKKARS